MKTIREQIMNNRLLKFLVYAMFFALPFERILTFNFAGFTVKLSYLIGILLICSYLFFLVTRKISLKLSLYDYILLLFVFFSYTTIIWSIDKQITFVISSMLLFSSLVFLSIRNAFDKNKIEQYLNLFIWLGIATSVFALWQFFGDSFGLSQKYTLLSNLYVKSIFGFPRVQSTFFEPGFFANFLLIPIYLNIYKIIVSKKKYYFVSLLVILIAFFLTLSRGGLLALGATFMVFLVFVLLRYKHYFINVIGILAVVVVSALLSLGSINLVAGSRGINVYTNQSVNSQDISTANAEENASNFTRNYTVNVALSYARKHIFGIGTGAFGSLPEFNLTRQAGNARQTVNSVYPEILVEQGIQGLIVFLAFILLIIGLLFSEAWKGNLLGLVFGCIVTAIFLQYASFSTLYLMYVWVTLGLAVLVIHRD